MAEVTALRNNALPYPIYGAPFGIVAPIFDADGDLVTGASGLDSEISKNGDTPADCTNEATEIGSSGKYYLLLTGTELTADVVDGVIKTSTSGAKTTPFTLYPRKLVTIRSGTAASAGSLTSTIVLDSGASDQDDFYNGMVCIATIDGTVEVRLITDYVGSTKSATVTPDWNTAPDNNDTFVIKLPEGWQIHQANLTQIAGVIVSASAAQLGVNVVNFGGNAGTFSGGRPEVNTSHFGGTAGTFSSGRPEVNTTHAAGTAWGSGAITAATFAADAITAAKVASDVGTEIATAVWASGTRTLTSISGLGIALASKLTKYVQLLARKDSAIATDNATELTEINADGGSGSGAYANTTDAQEAIRDNMGTPQTGDAYARLGAPVGASISADIAGVKTQTGAIETDTQDIQSRLPAALVSGRMDASVGAMQNDVMTAAAAAADLTTELQAGLATAADLATVEGKVDDVRLVTNKLETTLESAGGSPETFKFTEIALENAPGGGGGGTTDWDATERAQIRYRLGLDGATNTPSATPNLATAAAVSSVDGKIGTPANLGSGATLAKNLEDIEAQTDDIGAAGAGLTALGDTRLANLDAPISEVPTALLDESDAVESGLTVRGALRLALAALAGKLSGANTSTSTFRNVGDTKNRIVATTDATGRTSVTTDTT